MSARSMLPALLLILAGCAAQEPRKRLVHRDRPVDVDIPVTVDRVPPQELLEPVGPAERIQWIAPTAEGASACLTVQGAETLRAGVWSWQRRIEAWQTWATTPADTEDGE